MMKKLSLASILFAIFLPNLSYASIGDTPLTQDIKRAQQDTEKRVLKGVSDFTFAPGEEKKLGQWYAAPFAICFITVYKSTGYPLELKIYSVGTYKKAVANKDGDYIRMVAQPFGGEDSSYFVKNQTGKEVTATINAHC